MAGAVVTENRMVAQFTLPLSDATLNRITDALNDEFPDLHALRMDEPDGRGMLSFYAPSPARVIAGITLVPLASPHAHPVGSSVRY